MFKFTIDLDAVYNSVLKSEFERRYYEIDMQIQNATSEYQRCCYMYKRNKLKSKMLSWNKAIKKQRNG